ncbi:MAG: Crp/Fnr family transcriptional regulator [Bacteroidota bacterium]|uniref:Crp/Fnr family transcriptional regulator n=1 Tax=Nonlabens tegetincola TaxID=323273 RepID=UPI000A202001|nr:Crp/Fnr family transcriptional regulator [Nonlabens tegetincola]ARN70353.1 Crp/Fnr family transcriptional regulator [Nonlabens tegetincola]MEE2801538.1 Crp/Fnr family transcriptional regulator [Bacteroidota bacterium]
MTHDLSPLRKHIEEIVSLTDSEWQFVASHFEYRSLKKHQFVIQTGQVVDHEFWILKGLLRTYSLDENGKEHILQFASENYWISDYHAYQYQMPATLFLDCLEDTHFLSLSFESRELICKEVPAMANFFRVKLNYGFVHLQQRVLSHLTQTVEQRYERLIDEMPHLIQRVPKKLLASYLGVSRETLSRLKV